MAPLLETSLLTNFCCCFRSRRYRPARLYLHRRKTGGQKPMFRYEANVEVGLVSLPFEDPSVTNSLLSRKAGVGELYTYLPLDDENKKVLENVPPHSIPNPDHGFSVGRGAFDWEEAVGNWVTVACRIKLNDVDSSNGNPSTSRCSLVYTFLTFSCFLSEIQLWIDGKSVIIANGLSLRESSHSIIKGMHFQTFFGGELLSQTLDSLARP